MVDVDVKQIQISLTVTGMVQIIDVDFEFAWYVGNGLQPSSGSFLVACECGM